MKKILIVDDDTTFCLMLQSFLLKQGYDVTATGTVTQATAFLDKTTFDIILSDYRLPDKNGIELLEEILKTKPNPPVIIMTSYGDIKLAVKAIKLGAYDYITKPVNPDELLELVKNALEPVSIKTLTPNSIPLKKDNHFIEGVSPSWEKIQEHIKLAGPTFLSVIIEGESGTGKEYVARKIHEASNRSGKPFVAIDCGTLSNELAISELFGHVKGAFTGAVSDKKGQFELANGGTVFLDEIGNLNYDVQVKLLRAIQERTISKAGATKEISIDVRILVATNENLENLVKKGVFREDLYHRLNEFKINIDALRYRKEDIPVFANAFLQQSNNELGKNIIGFDTEAMEKILNYYWPGNLRELKNIVRKSVLFAKGIKISSNNLPSEIAMNVVPFTAEKTETSDLKVLSENFEKETILRTLEKVYFNKSKAAKLLNIDRKTLYTKLKEYDIRF